MSAYVPQDTEWLVAQAIAGDMPEITGVNVGATMVPADLEDRLPFVLVQAQGGTVADRVIDNARLNVDTWAETPSEAMRAAHAAFGACMRLSDRSDVFRGATGVSARPYASPDEEHPTLARYRFLIVVTTITER